jgi:ferredoxin/flavodoxin
MKSLVIYFSQAGNTLKIAEKVHQGISKFSQQCDILRLKDVQDKELQKYDLIGLGSPVWNSRPSYNMTEFIYNAHLPKNKHYFYFCTHGTMPGETISIAVESLRKRGLIVIGWKDWYGSVFLPYMPKPYYTDGHPDAIDLEAAEDFGKEIAERSLRIRSGEVNLIPSMPEGRDYIEIYGKSVPDFHTKPPEFISARTREFAVNKQKCNQCGICADNCPTSNIEVSSSSVLFKKNDCGKCWYCEQICPTGAIEYDWEAIVNTMRKHSIKELEDSLMSAETKGRFRRLVLLENISWDTPWYKTSKHPRLHVQ